MTLTATPASARKPRRAKPGAAVSQAAQGFDERVQLILEQVRERGLKLTPQRIAILRELAADPTHPTAQELFERLRPSLPTMSFATVYNTLDALASAGLCAALSLSPGAARFDPNMQPHHHAVCDRCGLIRDIPAHSPPVAPAALSEPPESERAALPPPSDDPRLAVPSVPGFTVRSVEKIFRGLCAECAAKAARAPRRRDPSKKPPQPARPPKAEKDASSRRS